MLRCSVVLWFLVDCFCYSLRFLLRSFEHISFTLLLPKYNTANALLNIFSAIICVGSVFGFVSCSFDHSQRVWSSHSMNWNWYWRDAVCVTHTKCCTFFTSIRTIHNIGVARDYYKSMSFQESMKTHIQFELCVRFLIWLQSIVHSFRYVMDVAQIRKLFDGFVFCYRSKSDQRQSIEHWAWNIEVYLWNETVRIKFDSEKQKMWYTQTHIEHTFNTLTCERAYGRRE